MLNDLILVVHTITFTICAGGAVLLFLRSDRIRSRLLMATTLLIWGALYGWQVAIELQEVYTHVQPKLLSPISLVTGIFFLILLLFYPLEVVRPGWLKLRRLAWLLFPFLFSVSLYFFVLLVFDIEPCFLANFGELSLNLARFDVWYRFVFLLVFLAYLVFMYWLVWNHHFLYRQWCNDNYAEIPDMDIGWLRYYVIGILLLSILYVCQLFNGGTGFYLAHAMLLFCMLYYFTYKSLFHANPYSEDFFSNTLSEDVVHQEVDTAFREKLPAYCETLKQWFSDEKPYLDKNFKLMQVAQILPLNRTYLSRVFNDGMGDSFSNVVRRYRIAEAERLLIKEPDMAISQISEKCGFSSPSVFYRSFVQVHDGVTPSRFRKQ